MSKSVLVIAGEISGDMHAARVVEAVRSRQPDVRFWGIGGDELEKAGMEVLYHVRDMAVMGLTEVLQRYFFFRKVFHRMQALARERRPDAVWLVDYPGFNLPFARKMNRLGIKVLYYVCPQVWAWRRSRIRRMARDVDRLLVIFPFEVEVFSGTGLRVDFVGHPLVEETQHVWHGMEADLPWPGEERVALLPGSRVQEVERILPVMLEAARRLERMRKDMGFLIAAPSSKIAEVASHRVQSSGVKPERIEIVVGRTREALKQARAAMVASGTATIETALMRCPMIVVYKTAALTYWFGRRLVCVPDIGMVNVVAGKRICPEFVQQEAQPEKMAEAMEAILDDTPERTLMVKELESVAKELGEGGSAGRAAEILLEEIST